MIKLLEKRGKAISNLNWNKKEEVDKELKKNFEDKKFQKNMQRISKAFIIFETEEGKNLALKFGKESFLDKFKR